MTALVTALKKRWPELVLHYHRHAVDGLFLPACAAAAAAGCEILDAGLGASVRSYGQGDLLSLAAAISLRPSVMRRTAVCSGTPMILAVMSTTASADCRQ